MRENYLVGGITLAVVLATVGFAAVVFDKPKPMVTVKCRALDALFEADPEFFVNTPLLLITDGCQLSEDSKEIVYRKQANLPPVVVMRFAEAQTVVPKRVIGLCTGRQDGAVVIVNCRDGK